ncbi:MAG: DUF899 family protein [Myxococcales bacterium]|nr:DUF899 family protein [Myxococcales bacterium]
MSDDAPRFPGESAAYREARNALLEAELALRARVEEVAVQRRALPLGGEPPDYVFEERGEGGVLQQTRLSELFADGQDSLIVYSFMYGPKMERACPACTSLLDALDGQVAQITQRASMAVVARSPIDRILGWAEQRGWRNLRLLSSADNDYNRDYRAESPEGSQLPACNVFVRRDGQVCHFWSAELLYAELEGHPRHMDPMWPLWNFLDLTPEGRGDFFPQV